MYLLQLLNNPLDVIIFLASILIAVAIHEYAHAATAYYFGDDTPRLMGRVTLNPLAHIDPIGAIFFLLAGFGWGKPVIINPMRLPKRIYELYVSLAGPASNLLFALLINTLSHYVLKSFAPVQLISALSVLATVSVSLAAFNVIPIPPLDGSSILEYFYPGYKSFGAQQGMILLIALLIIPGPNGSLLSSIINPIFHFFTLITLGGQ